MNPTRNPQPQVQSALPPAQTPAHRCRVHHQTNPDIPSRPWKAECTTPDCQWTWHSRWHVMALRMAEHHALTAAVGRTR